MKKSLLLLALAMLSLGSFAQQDPQLTHWMFDRISFNPAAAGIYRQHSASIFYRTQWVDYSGQPKTALFNYNGYYKLGGHDFGFGASFFNDHIGQQTNNNLRLSASYMHDLGGKTLAVGVNAGFFGQQLGKDFNPVDKTDAVVPNKAISQSTGDAGIGVMIYDQDKYYFGVSATHLPGLTLDKVGYKMARHLYAMGGYNFKMGEGPLVLRTNALVKTDLKASPTMDFNANILWNDMLWFGASFRPGDAISPMTGIQYKFAPIVNGRKTTDLKLMFGYAYDVTTSDIRTYSSGSHEIFLTLFWNILEVPVKAKYGNPRFL